MHILIDIDDDLYTRLFDNGEDNETDMRRACVAIRKGTLLPRGHGRLIDADHLIQELSVVSSRPIKSQLYILREAQTIIEADKTEEDNKKE